MFVLNTTFVSLFLALTSVVLAVPTPGASLSVPRVPDADCVNACAPIISASAACTPSVVNQLDFCNRCITDHGMVDGMDDLMEQVSNVQTRCLDANSTPSDSGAPEQRSSGTGRRVFPRDVAARAPTLGMRGAISLLFVG
ncbi:hypothetical protein FB45DRAFT_906635 [Roridomyces roridus]|uniref:Uncharacterized protein n=1 Tax=Roridomyces roridus TaxID=1738132 RepID=A0AAD7FSY0_9AGAR|nr:hypothetical protein FB45DRAFT_906635 [Roridomyces roridus]